LAVLKRVTEETPRPIQEILPEVPDWLCSVIAKLHAKAPEDRFQTAQEVVELLNYDRAKLHHRENLPSSPALRANHSNRLIMGVIASCLVLLFGIWTSGILQSLTSTLTNGNTAKPNGSQLDVPAAAVVSPGNEAPENPDNSTSYSWPEGSPPPAVAPFGVIRAQRHQNVWAKHLGVPVEYVNSLGVKFRLIPPGEFFMGSTPEEINSALPSAGDDLFWQGCIRSEAPRHRVVLTQAIYVSTCEITQAEYQDIMGVNPSWFSATGEGKDHVADIDTSRLPVELVNWNQAVEFCTRLSEREDLPPVYLRNEDAVEIFSRNGYRLPTEAEWEFACRAGTTSPHWTGEQDERLAEAAWFDGGGDWRPHPVGQLRPNPFGLFDLHGNVNEWVQDMLKPDYYSYFEHTTAVDPLGPELTAGWRVVRGGDFYYSAWDCRSSARYCADPAARPHFAIGFRLALPTAAVSTLTTRKQVE
jgi:formylglycine-generating enzyme required for sulfatase activity